MTDTRTMRRRVRWSGRAALWAMAAVTLASSGCDESIDPLQSTELAYSISGHLDPTLDTQWIRVAPFRTSIFSTPDPVDAVVTIEELETGRVIELVPTPYAVPSGNFGDSLFAYNFRTTEQINYEATYRLMARRSNGATSSSMAQIPADLSHLPTTVLITQSTRLAPLDRVQLPIGEGEHLAMLQTVHYPPPDSPCQDVLFYQHHGPEGFGPAGPGVLEGSLRKLDPQCATYWERIDLRIIRSRAEWPFDGTSDYSHSNAFTNIENGIGFFGGVVTTTVPYDDCTLVGSGVPTFCDLHYGPETATLTVTLIDGTPPENIELRGGGPFNPSGSLRRGQESWRRTRTVSARLSPRILQHRYPGLLPGPYHLKVESQFIGGWTLFCEERTLVLEPGEHHLEITMERVFDFPPNEPVNADGCREG